MMSSGDEIKMPEPQALHLCVHFEDDSYWATVDEFPGVFAAGDDLEELRASLEEGISLVLAAPGQDAVPVRLSPLKPKPVATAASSELVYA